MGQMEKASKSLAETAQIAIECLEQLVKEKPQVGKATVVALQGDLGSGKTTFTQAVARALGITCRVTSPTFVIMKNYRLSGGIASPTSKAMPWRNLIHIDCYRLDVPKDLLRLGWKEIVADKNNLILVEWPERVGELLSNPSLKIKFEVVDETSRKIIYG